MFKWSESITPSIWSKNPTVQNFTVIAGQSFVKPEFAKVADPYIVVENMTYSSGGLHHSVEHWEELVEYSRASESGTLAFGIYTDPKDKNRMWTLAAYESEAYLRDVHSKSAVAKEVEEHTAGMRKGRVQVVLQKRGGFLFKGEGGCA